MSRPSKLAEGARLLSWGSADFSRLRAKWREAMMGDHSLHHSTRVLLWWASSFFANDKLDAWPSLTTLAAKAGMSERHAGAALARGQSAGWIDKSRGGFSKANHYRLAMPASVLNHSSELKSSDRNCGSYQSGTEAPVSPELGFHLTLPRNLSIEHEGAEVPSEALETACSVVGHFNGKKAHSAENNTAAARDAAQNDRENESDRREHARKAALLRERLPVEFEHPRIDALPDWVLANAFDIYGRDLEPSHGTSWQELLLDVADDLARDSREKAVPSVDAVPTGRLDTWTKIRGVEFERSELVIAFEIIGDGDPLRGEKRLASLREQQIQALADRLWEAGSYESRQQIDFARDAAICLEISAARRAL